MAAAALTYASGFLFCLFWLRLTGRARSGWIIPSDVWVTFRQGQYVSWGSLPWIYKTAAGYGQLGLPGMAILLAPFAAIADGLGLVINVPWLHISIPRPSAFLVVGPVLMLPNVVLILVIDRWVKRAGTDLQRRTLCALVVGGFSWAATAWYGHPADVLALAASIQATSFFLDERPAASGWLLGVAIAIHPLALTFVPIWVGLRGTRATLLSVARSLILPIGLLAVFMIVDPADTTRAIFHQPSWPYPAINHPTPWVYLSRSGARSVTSLPERLLTLAVAGAVGLVGTRRVHHDRAALLWVFGACLAVRCFFEPVMCPYYIVPSLVLFMASTTRPGMSRRLIGAIPIAVVANLLASDHTSPWTWFLEVDGLLLALGLWAWRLPKLSTEDDTSPATRITMPPIEVLPAPS